MHLFKRLIPEILLLSMLTAGTASAQFISIVSGDGQVVTQNNVPQNPMVVVVRNSQCQPIPGTQVSWSLNGQGSLIGGATTTTDPDGVEKPRRSHATAAPGFCYGRPGSARS